MTRHGHGGGGFLKMPENGNRNQMWERLLYMIVLALVTGFMNGRTVKVETKVEKLKAIEVEDAENFYELLRYTTKNCTCEE
jgi:hypothetical protein